MFYEVYADGSDQGVGGEGGEANHFEEHCSDGFKRLSAAEAFEGLQSAQQTPEKQVQATRKPCEARPRSNATQTTKEIFAKALLAEVQPLQFEPHTVGVVGAIREQLASADRRLLSHVRASYDLGLGLNVAFRV